MEIVSILFDAMSLCPQVWTILIAAHSDNNLCCIHSWLAVRAEDRKAAFRTDREKYTSSWGCKMDG